MGYVTYRFVICLPRYTTNRFVIMETTNGVYNKTLYDAIKPQSVLMWQRVQVRTSIRYLLLI